MVTEEVGGGNGRAHILKTPPIPTRTAKSIFRPLWRNSPEEIDAPANATPTPIPTLDFAALQAQLQAEGQTLGLPIKSVFMPA